jgi:ribosomal protein S18 acetylase RimI-like enzyme
MASSIADASPLGLEVRPVEPDEYEAAGAVVVHAYEALGNEMTSFGYADELRDVAHRVTGSEVIVALQDGTLVGCVTFVPDMTSPWAEGVAEGESAVRMLGVDPQAQGRGAGRALLQACIDRAAELGSEAVFLHSTKQMEVAQQMYLRTGFVRVPDRDWFPLPDFLLMAFRLDLTAD